MLKMLVLFILGAGIYFLEVRRTGNVVNLKGLLTLGIFGGTGLACLKLSRIQTEWSWKTWFCLLIVVPFFSLGDILGQKRNRQKKVCLDKKKTAEILYYAICGTAFISVAAFTVEAVLLGYIPFFADTGHAYLEFHITGIHYFTVQSVMIPAMTVLYWKTGENTRKEKVVLAVCNLLAMLIPVLCVTRFHLIFGIGLAVLTYCSAFREKISIKRIWKPLMGIAGSCLILYIVISVMRNQSASYLNGIFEMKNEKIPVWIAQPYMYITGNYENFNYMIVKMKTHAYDGVRMLYPFFALTGLKFLFPVQISRPPYIVKKELSTFTMFYDAYYDFGIAGIIVFSLILGFCCGRIERISGEDGNLIIHLFYGQMAIYLLLSFFTTWFSNPTVWFRLIMTAILYILIGKRCRNEMK